MSQEPIKSEEEVNEVFNFLVITTAETLGVDLEQAEKRVTALFFNSAILTDGDPTTPETQKKIEEFLKIHVD